MSMFCIDPHVHTAETSACAWMPAKHVVDLYRALGFSGIVITDHLYEKYIARLPECDNWHACVEAYLTGYRLAKHRGDACGLNVLLGAEITFPENSNDYLIYGFDESFLFDNPYLHRLGLKAFYRKFCDRVLILQAHPYRGGNKTVFAEYLHGAEAVNANQRHQNDNKLAWALCQEHPDWICTCGSDTHRPGDEGKGWLAFDAPVPDTQKLAAGLRAGEYRLCSHTEEDIIDQANRATEKRRRQ